MAIELVLLILPVLQPENNFNEKTKMKILKNALLISIPLLFSVQSFAAEKSLAEKTDSKTYHVKCYTPSGFNVFESDVLEFNVPVASFISVVTLEGKTVRLTNAICKIEEK
jgi:hypothetical protein